MFKFRFKNYDCDPKLIKTTQLKINFNLYRNLKNYQILSNKKLFDILEEAITKYLKEKSEENS